MAVSDDVSGDPIREAGRGKGAYAKGNARRELLVDASADLLQTRALDDVSLKDIADHAGVPVGSAYHFFANAQAVYVELANRFMRKLAATIAEPYDAQAVRSWQSLFGAAVDRAAALYAANPAYRQLILGGKAPPEIKLADRLHDEQIGELMIDVISRHFEFPALGKRHDIFFYVTEIVDLLFSLSVMRSGEITAAMAEEAKTAGIAYLSVYLPEQLPRR